LSVVPITLHSYWTICSIDDVGDSGFSSSPTDKNKQDVTLSERESPAVSENP